MPFRQIAIDKSKEGQVALDGVGLTTTTLAVRVTFRCVEIAISRLLLRGVAYGVSPVAPKVTARLSSTLPVRGRIIAAKPQYE
jgi:hypothetical protein